MKETECDHLSKGVCERGSKGIVSKRESVKRESKTDIEGVRKMDRRREEE